MKKITNLAIVVLGAFVIGYLIYENINKDKKIRRG